MITAFWNINGGRNSRREKLATLTEWCADVQPHLIMLQEVGQSLIEGNPSPLSQIFPGYENIAYANTLNQDRNPGSKCLVALVRQGFPAQAGLNIVGRPLKFHAYLIERRMIVKVNVTAASGDTFAIWNLHANASAQGGVAAVVAAREKLQSEHGRRDVYGGDFNCQIERAHEHRLLAVAPLGYPAPAPAGQQPAAVGPLFNTQWSEEPQRHTRPDEMPQMRLSAPVMFRPEPHGVIDYVACAHGDDGNAAFRAIHAKANCSNGALWNRIVTNFDHAPVVYDIR